MNIYLKAAINIFYDIERLSCYAISREMFNDDRKKYHRIFSSEKWKPLFVDHVKIAGGKEWRLTALCLATAMYDSGDL